MFDENRVWECYSVMTKKVGNSSFDGKLYNITGFDGVVRLSDKYNGMEPKKALAKHLQRLQASGAYSRIKVKDKDSKVIYDWTMDNERLAVQEKAHKEYIEKRKALKAHIAELEKQIEELDWEWFK